MAGDKQFLLPMNDSVAGKIYCTRKNYFSWCAHTSLAQLCVTAALFEKPNPEEQYFFLFSHNIAMVKLEINALFRTPLPS